MVTLTNAAIEYLTKLISKRRNSGTQTAGIFFKVKTTGCSGLAYIVEFANSDIDLTESIDLGEFKLYVDLKSQSIIDGMVIDYRKNKLEEGLEFINPNETSRCGCGKSFQV